MIINFIQGGGTNALVKAYQGKMDDTIDPNTGIITSGTTGHTALCYVYRLDNGTYSLVKVDIEDVVKQNDFKEGLKLSGRTVSVKIDNNSESFLTVSMSGVSINGVQSAITSAVTIEKDRAISAETELWEAISASTSGLAQEIIARMSGDSALTLMIEAEEERAVSAETMILEALSAETIARENEDNLLWNAISGVSSGLAKEVQDRIEADNDILEILSGISSGLAQEVIARMSGDSALTIMIEAEEDRAKDAEMFLSGAIESVRVHSDDSSINVVSAASGTNISVNTDNLTIGKSGGVLNTLLKLSAITPSSSNVKEEFALVNKDGTEIVGSAHIKIYKDSSLIKTYVGKMDDTIDENTGVITSGTTGHTAMCWVYQLADGKYTLVKVDIESILQENEFKDGFVVSGHSVYIKIDTNSEGYLTVSPSGLKLDGVDLAIASAVTIEKNRAISAETMILEALSAETEDRIDADEALELLISGVSSGLAAEIQNRMSGDSALTLMIEAEEERAMSAETMILEALSAETIDRIAADEALELLISGITSGLAAEIQNRIDADSALTIALNAEIQNRIDGDSNLNTALIAEILNRESGDTLLWEAISGETEDRIDADSALTIAISAEEARAIAAEGIISTNLSAETENRISADTVISTALSAETEARISADTIISSALSAETQNRIDGDSALTIALNNEISARTSADTIIASALSAETQARISGDSALTKTILDNEKVVAAAINNLQNKFSAYTPTSGMSTINGQSITVGGNIVIGGGTSGETVIELTQAQYDALSAYSQNTTYIITDATEVNVADFWTSAQTMSAVTNAISAESARSETAYFQKDAISAYTPTSGFCTINSSAITAGGNLTIEGKVYSAGTNIDITNDIISVTGLDEYTKSAWTESQYMKKATSGVNEGNVILSSNNVGQPVMSDYCFKFLTQAEYNALAVKDNYTIYFIIS